MFDEDLPKKNKAGGIKNLEPMSLDELRVYISDLKLEIDRAELEIARKSAHMNAASSLFKS
ncbi:MAG: DUF1192 domain-containing protein [Pseudobdellovibrionaceae bacterium]|jgi:uncharacterized small protein (DUF1192 family)|nr:DUF1192 domain-containing protein [Pseudobdellovibrionaceae bacterium]